MQMLLKASLLAPGSIDDYKRLSRKCFKFENFLENTMNYYTIEQVRLIYT